MHGCNSVDQAVPAFDACNLAFLNIYLVLRIRVSKLLPYPFRESAVTCALLVTAIATHEEMSLLVLTGILMKMTI